MQIPVYSPHAKLDACAALAMGAAQACAHVSWNQAVRMIKRGEAKPVDRIVNGVSETVAIQRTYGQPASRSDTGISAAEMGALVRGSGVAKAKVKEWGKLQQQNFERLIVAA